MKKLFRNNLFLLFIVFIFALSFRVWNLAKYPEAIDEDEMANGYYAFSLLKNGTDEYGHKFPIYFESVKDYKYGLYSYLSVPVVGVFGLNPFSTRFLACLAGSLSVVAIYFLALEIFPNPTYGIIASILLAITPYHIHFSRVGYSNVLGSLFSILSILFFIRFYKKNVTKNAVLSFIFLIFSIFTYQTYRILLPAFFIGFICVFNPLKMISRKKGKVLLLTFVSVILVLLSFIPTESRKRAHSFNELVDKPALVEQYSEDFLMSTNLLVTRVFHNKYLSFFKAYSERYFSYFDPRFLFIEISSTTERHSIPSIGFVYLVDVIFIFWGISHIFSKIKSSEKYIPFILLFCSPLAASMTMEPRSVTRSIIMVIPIVLISAFGIYSLFEFKKLKKYLLLLVAIVYSISLLNFLHQYLVHKIIHHPWYSDVGLKEMVGSVNRNYDIYSNVVVAQGHYMPFLFYNKVNPKYFLKKSLISNDQNDGIRVKEFGKIIFNMPYNCPLAGKSNVLYVCFGYQIPKNSRVVDLIKFRDGEPAIILVEFGKEDEKLPEKVKYFSETDLRFPNGLLPSEYNSFWPIKE